MGYKCSELKACPFCGSNAELRMRQFECDYDEECYWTAECKNMNCSVDIGWFDYPRQAIEAWNTRAERTCKQVITKCNDGLMPPFTAHCSECGSKWGYTPNYCPDCGAKVVD